MLNVAGNSNRAAATLNGKDAELPDGRRLEVRPRSRTVRIRESQRALSIVPITCSLQCNRVIMSGTRRRATLYAKV